MNGAGVSPFIPSTSAVIYFSTTDFWTISIAVEGGSEEKCFEQREQQITVLNAIGLCAMCVLHAKHQVFS